MDAEVMKFNPSGEELYPYYEKIMRIRESATNAAREMEGIFNLRNDDPNRRESIRKAEGYLEEIEQELENGR